ncbi:hypothetical protein CYY_001496 [Polysphondylium violaceum]|uniref:Uncharacterized protein n=1 Tax=Polysphondylium violaceum TaxID=133409 RepID=A0A8J4V1K2_9MYCE|nr:hypothetical protein CYY_001496 [Polysphondylium violaceum]
MTHNLANSVFLGASLVGALAVAGSYYYHLHTSTQGSPSSVDESKIYESIDKYIISRIPNVPDRDVVSVLLTTRTRNLDTVPQTLVNRIAQYLYKSLKSHIPSLTHVNVLNIDLDDLPCYRQDLEGYQSKIDAIISLDDSLASYDSYATEHLFKTFEKIHSFLRSSSPTLCIFYHSTNQPQSKLTSSSSLLIPNWNHYNISSNKILFEMSGFKVHSIKTEPISTPVHNNSNQISFISLTSPEWEINKKDDLKY